MFNNKVVANAVELQRLTSIFNRLHGECSTDDFAMRRVFETVLDTRAGPHTRCFILGEVSTSKFHALALSRFWLRLLSQVVGILGNSHFTRECGDGDRITAVEHVVCGCRTIRLRRFSVTRALNLAKSVVAKHALTPR